MNKLANDTLPDDLDQEMGFTVPHDVPVPYMYRTRTYYQALGYERPYRWAQYVEVPFTALTKPLSESKVAVITTAAPYLPEAGDQGPGAPYNSAAKFYNVYSFPIDPEPDLRISHVGIDRAHTTATDKNSWLPLEQFKRRGTKSIGTKFLLIPITQRHSAASFFPMNKRLFQTLVRNIWSFSATLLNPVLPSQVVHLNRN